MKEILPGIHHWTARHEKIGFEVSSYYVAPARALIDPMLPPAGGIDAFSALPDPQVILLTTRHHYRHSDAFVERFGSPVRCHESGLHEFQRGEKVDGFAFGEEVAPGIVVVEMDTISPDDSVLAIDAGAGALSFADAIVHWGGGKLGFVPDQYMDDPEVVKPGVREKATRMLDELAFDALLFAHGEPLPTGGRDALRVFVDSE